MLAFLRFISFKQVITALLFVFVLNAIESQPQTGPAPESGKRPQSERNGIAMERLTGKIVLLPFRNDSGRADLDFLSQGIPEVLINGLSIGFTVEKKPGLVFRLSSKASGPLAVNSEVPRRVFMDLQIASLDRVTYESQLRGDYVDIARRAGCRYVIAGWYTAVPASSDLTQAEPLTVTAQVFDATTGFIYKQELASFRRTLYDDLPQLSARLATSIEVPGRYKRQIDSNPASAMIYLDGRFVGRTPVSVDLPPGEYDLRAAMDDHKETKSSLRVAGPGSTSLNLIKEPRRAGLTVTSEPSGADVYLDLTKIGKTPLERRDLPAGAHRVRITLPGHIDRFSGVQLKADEIQELSFKMTEGDTVAKYKDPGNVILDWNNHDLSFYSFLNACGFYGGWIYYRVQAKKLSDSIRPEAPAISILQIPSLTLYQAYLIEENRQQVKAIENRGKVSAWGGSIMLILSGVFLYRGLAFDSKEVGEIGVIPTLYAQRETHPDPRRSATTRLDFGLSLRF